MPIRTCSEKGKPGFRCGNEGTCYTYTPKNRAERVEAKKKAIAQCIAIGEKP